MSYGRNTGPVPSPKTSNYQKYQTSNPLVRRLIQRFTQRVCTLVREFDPERIVDLGCGEGIVAAELSALGIDFQYLGIDQNPESIEAARHLNPDLGFEQGDIIERAPQRDWADVAICLEVLEHLAEPEEVLGRIMAWTNKAAIVSVPWEPYFRLGNLLRLKDLALLGNHPEHIQQFRPKSLENLLKEFAAQVRVETCFPWLIGVIQK
jgi:trans-aconitate methyltransferase